jgi:tyrosine-protein kinase Etk/Wzc
MEDALGGALASMVKPVIRRGTRLIDLYVINRDPAMAQRLAEAIGREYIRMSIERRANFSQESLRYLMEEEERLKTNLQRSEAAVAEYKAKTPDALQLGVARPRPERRAAPVADAEVLSKISFRN